MSPFVLSVALLYGAAPADAAASDVDRAGRLVEKELRYSEAVPLLRSLSANPALTEAERAQVYWWLGVALVAQGATAPSEAAFGELLRLRPDYAVDPMVSPKIRSAFETAKRRAAQSSGVNAILQAAPPPPVASATGPPWYRRWWFYTALTVVAVAAVTTSVMLLHRDADPTPTGTLPAIQLE
ncbi:MAG: hypothetical protein HY903_12680 [Deltaproteobacteria bacterium]|nr:hypothetical protein [Deltaproteobacteria bacterium]